MRKSTRGNEHENGYITRECLLDCYKRHYKELGGAKYIADRIGINRQFLNTFSCRGIINFDNARKLESFLQEQGKLPPPPVIHSAYIPAPPAPSPIYERAIPLSNLRHPTDRMIAGLKNMVAMLEDQNEPLAAKLPLLRASLIYVCNVQIPLIEEILAGENAGSTTGSDMVGDTKSAVVTDP